MPHAAVPLPFFDAELISLARESSRGYCVCEARTFERQAVAATVQFVRPIIKSWLATPRVERSPQVARGRVLSGKGRGHLLIPTQLVTSAIPRGVIADNARGPRQL